VARVLCLGAAILDTIFRLDAIPTVPTKVLPTDCVQIGAGMASAAATAVARLGGEAHFWGRVGDDAAGRQYAEDIGREGVRLDRLRFVAGARTPVSTILVDRAGDRLVVPYYDPALDQDASWLPLDEVAGFDVVLADFRWPAGARALLGAAQAAGVPAVLDADVAPSAVMAEIVPLASHPVFSEPAFRSHMGRDDVVAALGDAAEPAGGLIGFTRGAGGFHWKQGGRLHHVAAPGVQAVDTLSAGDVFHGAFALGLAEGMDAAAAGRFAVAAASLKCTRFGGRLGAPQRAEVEAFLQAAR